MKITVNKMDLVAGLNKLVKVINSKNHAILQNVKISAENNKVELTGIEHDLIGIVNLEYGTIQENGYTLLNFKDLHSFIKKSKGENITIENDNNSVTVTSGKVKLKVDSLDVTDFPSLPELDYKEVVLTNEEFKKAIENTGYCISKSEIRPILNAINIKVNEYGMKFVSTDSHRLGQFKLNKDSNIDQLEVNPIGEGLKLAMKLLEKKNEKVTFKFDNRYTVLEFDNMQLYVRNIEGNYPETDRLIPESFTTELEMKTKELLDLLPQLSVFSKELNNVMVLDFENDNTTLSNQNVKGGKGLISSIVETKKEIGENVKLTFSLNYFEDALKALNSDNVKIKFNGKMKPFIIEGMGKGEKHLILPVRSY